MTEWIKEAVSDKPKKVLDWVNIQIIIGQNYRFKGHYGNLFVQREMLKYSKTI